MKDAGMLFEEKSDVAGYLGVLIDRSANNDNITLRQEGLTQIIIEPLHFDDNTSSDETPVDSYLQLDVDGEPPKELYNYATIDGMLGYLQSYSCTDINFAVSQVFVINFTLNALMN